jgi:ComF family protein
MNIALESSFRRARRRFVDFLFPPLCIACRAHVSDPGALCSDCWQAIQFIDGPMCECCGLPFDLDPGIKMRCAACHAKTPSFDKARALMRYDEKSRGPILALKHADRLDLVPTFGRWLDRGGRELVSESDIILPVPLHPTRLWSRRYNQSAELARALGRSAGKPVDVTALVRIRATPSQGAMASARARRRNMRGAFKVADGHKSAMAGRNILLVDDVLTSGATVDSCARALLRSGALNVDVLTFARVVEARRGPI